MSNEHFATIFTADAKDPEKGRDPLILKESGKGFPKYNYNSSSEQNKESYSNVYLYTEDVLHELSKTLLTMEQDGCNDDDLNNLLEERKFMSDILMKSAELVKSIAADFSGNRTFTKEAWNLKINDLHNILDFEEFRLNDKKDKTNTFKL